MNEGTLTKTFKTAVRAASRLFESLLTPKPAGDATDATDAAAEPVAPSPDSGPAFVRDVVADAKPSTDAVPPLVVRLPAEPRPIPAPVPAPVPVFVMRPPAPKAPVAPRPKKEPVIAAPRVEYLGFTSLETTREYNLRVHQGTTAVQDVTIVIESAAFVGKLVRYQDGPELCFHKLQRALAAAGDAQRMPERLVVTAADLADYAAAHAPKPGHRRAKPQPPPPRASS